MSERIGVYLCHCGTNIARTVDLEAVADHARTLPGVVTVKAYKYMCSDPGQELIKQDIEAQRLTRVVVSSCSPLMHEVTFRNVCEDAGLNRYLFQMSNIREQCSWVHPDRERATAKAKHLIAAAVRRVHHHRPLEAREVPVRPAVLVVGAGIAGIEAALRIAEAGKKVHLVETEPSIGGHMARFDKTFPTLDCAACILTPKMVQVGQHPNIELLTHAEVQEVSGYVGNFKVKVRNRPRYVDVDRCTGCGACVEVCPVEVPNRFEERLTTRKAIHRSFPQAVPNAFVIDKKGRAPCRVACPAGVHAQGYIALIRAKRYGEAAELLRRDIPLPSVCGRVCYHPCEDRCARGRVDEPVAVNALKRFVADWSLAHEDSIEPLPVTRPEKVAVLGSGPAGLACANEIIRRGYRVTVFDAASAPGGMLRHGIPDYRLPPRILDREIDRLKALGIEMQTGTRIEKVDDLFAEGYAAVFVAGGAPRALEMGVPGEGLEGVVGMLDFLDQVNRGDLTRLEGRVAVIGGGNSAIDAARAAVRLGAREVRVVYRRSRAEMPAHDFEIEEARQEGVEFEFLAAPVQVEGKEGKARRLVCIRMRLGEPDASGRRRPIPVGGSEFEVPVDLVIPAIGQAPDLGDLGRRLETTPRGWVQADPLTLETSERGVFAGGDVVTGPATVVEAFGAGKQAAESIDRYLTGVDLRAGREDRPPAAPAPDGSGVEERARIQERGLKPADRTKGFPEVLSTLTEEEALQEAARCLGCGVCAECMACVDTCDAAAIDPDQVERVRELEVGAIIVATGFELFDPKEIPRYGYGRFANVFTSLEFERLCHATGPTGGSIVTRDGRQPGSVAILHCIGSRDENHLQYCSRVCCMISLKFAHLVREKTGAEVYNFYIDVRAAGKGYEEFYKRLLDEGVHFIRGKAAEVTDLPESPEERGKLIVVGEDTLLGLTRRIPVDMVVLASGLRPRRDADHVMRVFSLGGSADSFFLEKHPKLAPVDTASDGVLLAGACQGPKDIPDSVAQGAAAAAGALSLIDRGKFVMEPVVSHIDAELCAGCKLCIVTCPYSAIHYDPDRKVSVVTQELCKGCGTCVAGCPAGAAQQENFEDVQVFAEVEGILAR